MKTKTIILLSCLSFGAISCASHPPAPEDVQTDAALGVDDQGDAKDAQSTLQEMQKNQLQAQKQHLERQATDPFNNVQR